jgi:hypothetical protein
MSVQYARVSMTIFALALVGARPLVADQATTANPLAPFEQAAAAYAQLQRDLSRQLPPLEITHDPEKIIAAAAARRSAMRRARADARPGDILTAEAGPILVARIRTAVRAAGMTTAELVRVLAEEGEGVTRAEVNGTFSWATAAGMPASILAALPPLPGMLQYRFVGPDLVLVDVEAGLIVDVLRDALGGNVD